MLKTILGRAKISPGIMIFILVMCGIAQAQSDVPSTKDLGESINIMWMLIAGFLVFLCRPDLPWLKRALPKLRMYRTR